MPARLTGLRFQPGMTAFHSADAGSSTQVRVRTAENAFFSSELAAARLRYCYHSRPDRSSATAIKAP